MHTPLQFDALSVLLFSVGTTCNLKKKRPFFQIFVACALGNPAGIVSLCWSGHQSRGWWGQVRHVILSITVEKGIFTAIISE